MNIVKTTVYIVLISLVLMLTSCKVYKLKHSDHEWQPYNKGDIVIFENSNSISDTINVTTSEILREKTINPYNFGNSKKEMNISFGKENGYELGLIRVSRNNQGTRLGLSGYTIFTKFGINIPIEDLSNFLIKDKKWGKSYLINNFKKYRFGDDSKIKSILYSKKWGYLKFNLINGGVL